MDAPQGAACAPAAAGLGDLDIASLSHVLSHVGTARALAAACASCRSLRLAALQAAADELVAHGRAASAEPLPGSLTRLHLAELREGRLALEEGRGGRPGAKLVAFDAQSLGSARLAEGCARERLRRPTALQALVVGRLASPARPHLCATVPSGAGHVALMCVAALCRVDAAYRRTQAVLSFATREQAVSAHRLVERLATAWDGDLSAVCASDGSVVPGHMEWLSDHVVVGAAAALRSWARQGHLRMWDVQVLAVSGADVLLEAEPGVMPALVQHARDGPRPPPRTQQVLLVARCGWGRCSPRRRAFVEKALAGAPVAWVWSER